MKPIEPCCLVCGYALRGLSTATPICPECGAALDWPQVLRTGPQHRWLYELGRGIAPIRFAKTAVRLLWPPAFWRAVSPEIPVTPRRLVSWLGLLLMLAYATSMAASTAWRLGLVYQGAGQPIILPGLRARMEFFLPGLYDAGELARDGTVKPLWFPDRSYPALIAGSLAVGIGLALLRRFQRNSQITPGLIARVIIYGLAPLAALWVSFAQFMSVAALNSYGLAGIKTLVALGRVSRVEYWLVVAWWIAYWWFAARRGVELKWWGSVSTVVVAVLAALLTVMSDWRFWVQR